MKSLKFFAPIDIQSFSIPSFGLPHCRCAYNFITDNTCHCFFNTFPSYFRRHLTITWRKCVTVQSKLLFYRIAFTNTKQKDINCLITGTRWPCLNHFLDSPIIRRIRNNRKFDRTMNEYLYRRTNLRFRVKYKCYQDKSQF
jgi:hypothetical protein